MNLRPYQKKAIEQLFNNIRKGIKRQVLQLATGGGKTVTFAGICTYAKRPVLILVHRKELMNQAAATLYAMTGIKPSLITAGSNPKPSKIYIGMVESTFKRLPKDVHLIIIDECHIANFNKVFDWVPDNPIIGFTATPLSANKRKPLNGMFEDIVCGVDIPELISDGWLVTNKTYSPTVMIDRRELKMKAGEFDVDVMAEKYRQPKLIDNTVKAYNDLAKGRKTIVFNCNIEHSKDVAKAFGDKARHVDGSMNGVERDSIFEWYARTPDAILCNVGIATTGFDSPPTSCIIVNRATKSIPLWLQMCGRGSRPYQGKQDFIIIDLGANAIELGDWCQPRDWEDIFHNPPKVTDGVAPVKNCPACSAIIPIQTRVCPYCFFEMKPLTQEQEMEELFQEYRLITQISVTKMIKQGEKRSHKPYYSFFKIGEKLSKTDAPFEVKLKRYHELADEWLREQGKKGLNKWHKDLCEVKLKEFLKTN